MTENRLGLVFERFFILGGPEGLHDDVGSLKRFRVNRHLVAKEFLLASAWRGFCIILQSQKPDADRLKRADLPDYEKIVNDNAKVQLIQEQFDALVSLAFNNGEGAVKDLFKLINAGNCTPADIEKAFVAWNKVRDANGNLIASKDQTDRRTQEAAIFNFARYP